MLPWLLLSLHVTIPYPSSDIISEQVFGEFNTRSPNLQQFLRLWKSSKLPISEQLYSAA